MKSHPLLRSYCYDSYLEKVILPNSSGSPHIQEYIDIQHKLELMDEKREKTKSGMKGREVDLEGVTIIRKYCTNFSKKYLKTKQNINPLLLNLFFATKKLQSTPFYWKV